MITTDDQQWLNLLKSYKRSAIRLEQQKIYLADVLDGSMNDWLAGATTPPISTPWSQQVAELIANGRTMERIRIFEDTPTPYQQWERWVSHPNVEAGEVQRYISRSAASAAGLDDAGDWWLLDGEVLILFSFEGLERTSVEVIDDPSRVAEAAHWWTVAARLAGLETAAA